MNKHTNRRAFVTLGALALIAPSFAVHATPTNLVQVWKDPNCGCCNDWVSYLQANGFTTEVFDTGNTAKRKQLGMPQQFGSCHTALIDGYVIEGHVPANDIKRLLSLRPKAIGLSVPGMVVGSPGMDGPVYKGRSDPYDVLLVLGEGKASVFKRYT